MRHGKFRSGLVIGEVAMSIVLLIGAGLMMRTLLALRSVDLGFNPENILVIRTPLPKGRYETAEQKKMFFQPLLRRLQALPGVKAATETSTLPPYGGIPSDIVIPGKQKLERSEAMFQLCGDGYLPTLGLRVLRGRWLSEADIEGARKVIVINQTMAHKFFGDEDPLGKQVKFEMLDKFPESPHDAYFEIIGITADAKNRGLQDPASPEAFMPYTVSGFGERGLLIRTTVTPMSILPSVRKEIWAIDSNVALTLTGSLEDYLQRFSYSQPQFGLMLLGAFASVGLVLVAIGVFSVMAYAVSLQTHEIGIRMALGAQRGRVLAMVFKRGLVLTGIGVILGELISVTVARLIKSQLWGVSAHDPVTFGAVIALIALVGIIACMVPARRATRVDPLVALRYE